MASPLDSLSEGLGAFPERLFSLLSTIITAAIMLSPSVRYEFYMNNSHAYYYLGDDSVNFHTCDEGTVSINGVNADSMFSLAKNALCGNQPLFAELSVSKKNLAYAKEMVVALNNFIDNSHNSEQTNDD